LGDHDDSKETLLNFHEFNPTSRLDSRMLPLPESYSRAAFLVSSRDANWTVLGGWV
jgi:hypothetical protein